MSKKCIEANMTAKAFNEAHKEDVEGCGIVLTGEGLDNPIQEVEAQVSAVYRKNGSKVDDEVVYETSCIAEYKIDFAGVTLRQLLEIAIMSIKTRVDISGNVADVIPAALPKSESKPKQSVKQAREAGVEDGKKQVLLQLLEAGAITKEFVIAQMPSLADQLS